MRLNNVLITGANGFLGKSLFSHIKTKYVNCSVFGVDIKGSSLISELDLGNEKRVKSFLLKFKPEYIYHLAGNARLEDFSRLLKDNAGITFHLLRAIKRINNYKPRIIVPSSAAEYGQSFVTGSAIREDSLLRPCSFYGLAKMTQTQLALLFAYQGMNILVARIFNVAGEATPASFSLGKFAYELALIKKNKQQAVIRVRNLESRRDFLDVNDVCKYLVAIAIKGKPAEVYNVCRGKSYSMRYLLNRMIGVSKVNGVTIIEGDSYKKGKDISDSFGSTKKIKKIAPDIKPVSIDNTLKNTFYYYLSRV